MQTTTFRDAPLKTFFGQIVIFALFLPQLALAINPTCINAFATPPEVIVGSPIVVREKIDQLIRGKPISFPFGKGAKQYYRSLDAAARIAEGATSVGDIVNFVSTLYSLGVSYPIFTTILDSCPLLAGNAFAKRRLLVRDLQGGPNSDQTPVDYDIIAALVTYIRRPSTRQLLQMILDSNYSRTLKEQMVARVTGLNPVTLGLMEKADNFGLVIAQHLPERLAKPENLHNFMELVRVLLRLRTFGTPRDIESFIAIVNERGEGGLMTQLSGKDMTTILNIALRQNGVEEINWSRFLSDVIAD